MDDTVNMEGVWFVYYFVPHKLEGNTIITINGTIRKSDVLSIITNHIYNDKDDATRALIPSPKHIVIGNLTRIGDLS